MIVYTVGTFDLLHVGHLALLEYCATLGDTVAVGVASDEVVKLYKPNIPIIPLEQRIEMLQALRCVDIVLPYHELDYLTVCEEVKADIFVIGEDWGRKPHNKDVENYFEARIIPVPPKIQPPGERIDFSLKTKVFPQVWPVERNTSSGYQAHRPGIRPVQNHVLLHPRQFPKVCKSRFCPQSL